LPDGRYFTAHRYFIANLAEAGKKLVFSKSVHETGILKINNLQ